MECWNALGPTTSTAMSTEPYRRKRLRPPTTPGWSRPSLGYRATLVTMMWAHLSDTQVSMLLRTHDNCGATSMGQDLSADRAQEQSSEPAVTSITHLASLYGNDGKIRTRRRRPGAGRRLERLGHRGLAVLWRGLSGGRQVPPGDDTNPVSNRGFPAT
jgi:hypothetical protein